MGIPDYTTVSLKNVYCCNDGCDAIIIMPEQVYNAFRKNHKSWYCYRGHSQYFTGKSDAEKLKEQLEAKERALQSQIKRTEWALQAEKKAELSRRAAKGQLTKVKNRIKNGVCPCCNRSFPDSRLAAHMKTKHPDYGNEKKQ